MVQRNKNPPSEIISPSSFCGKAFFLLNLFNVSSSYCKLQLHRISQTSSRNQGAKLRSTTCWDKVSLIFHKLLFYKIYFTSSSHSMAIADMNKSEMFGTNATSASKYIPKRPWICINWNPPFQTKIYLVKAPLNVSIVFEIFIKQGLKIDADCRPFRSVLWCCGSVCHELFTFIRKSSIYMKIENNGTGGPLGPRLAQCKLAKC